MVRAVDGVDLTVAPGTTLGIVGESGSGKSVLARTVMNILPRNGTVRPGSRIEIERRDTAGLDRAEARALGVPNRHGVPGSDDLADPRAHHRRTAHRNPAPASPAVPGRRGAARGGTLTSVGIPDARKRLGQYPHNLSGGMRQRVVIALALACSPRLLIADEPTTALDVTVQHQILTLLARLQRENEMAMVLITHDLGVVAGRTDEIAVMYAGRRVLEQAPTDELFRATRHPVSALDVSVQAQILDLLEDMKKRYDLSLLFIAHDLGRSALTARSTLGLQIPDSLPAGHRIVCRERIEDPGGQATALRRVPLPDRTGRSRVRGHRVRGHRIGLEQPP